MVVAVANLYDFSSSPLEDTFAEMFFVSLPGVLHFFHFVDLVQQEFAASVQQHQ